MNRERVQSTLILISLWFFLVGTVFAQTPSDTKVKRKAARMTPTPTIEPTPNPNLAPPKIKPVKAKNIEADYLPATEPVVLPNISFPEKVEPTPTPEPGMIPKDPLAAALLSAMVPGAGHAYSGEPLRGLFFAAAFGVSLYLTLDNLRLVDEANTDQRVARNETAGSLYGLATLAAYGFGIQDASSGARRYNRRHHLRFGFTVRPQPGAALALAF
jgi:hypothetical protein